MTSVPSISRFAEERPRHEVGHDDLFFSTTDAKGVITDSNEVFVRLSNYSREELFGAAHNIIRHPDMPGGAFKAMWDTLQAGDPFVAYVRNLAKNDSSYDVLATVTPLPDGGYLSVRTRPCTDTFDTIAAAYQEMNDVEHAAREAGANRRDAAAAGAEKLGEVLAGLGVENYSDLMWGILPAEVAARESSQTIDVEALAAANPTAAVAVDVYRALDQFMASQDALAKTVDEVKAAEKQLSEQSAAVVRVTGTVDDLDIDDTMKVLLTAPLRVWGNMHDSVGDRVAKLDAQLAELDGHTRHLRFRIALGRLHSLMVARFGAAEEDRADSMRMLVEVLENGLADMRTHVLERHRLARRAADRAGSLTRLWEVPRMMADSWLKDTHPEAFGPAAAPLVEQVREAMERSDESIAKLTELSETLSGGEEVGFEELSDAIGRLGAAVRGEGA